MNSGQDAGNISMFSNGPDAINSFISPFPGQGGARNQIRGQGFFNIDLGLAKRWAMPWSEKQSLQFRWEVFNITNSVRFNVQSSGARNRYLQHVWQLYWIADQPARDAVCIALRVLGPLNTLQKTAGKRKASRRFCFCFRSNGCRCRQSRVNCL